MRSLRCAGFVISLPLVLSMAACSQASPGSGAADGPGGKRDSADRADAAVSNDLVLDEADDGRTDIRVSDREDLIVRLPANPTAGYMWTIRLSDPALGEPSESFEPASEAIGSGGTSVFTWNISKLPDSPLGKHRIEIAYTRAGAERPSKVFDVTVKVYDEVAEGLADEYVIDE